MGVKLVVEVLDHAPADLTPAERLVLVVLAENANDATREGWPGMDLLARRSGLAPDSVQKVFRRLADRGLEVRLPFGTDRSGRPVFACKGRQSTYRLPLLAGRLSPDHRPPIEGGKPGPPSAHSEGKGRITVRQRADHGPPKGGSPSGPSPQEPSMNPHTPAAPNPGQPVLLTKTEIRLPQATQIILDGLHAAGYPSATPDDARAVHQAVCAKYGSRVNLGWLRTMANNHSYNPFYQDVRTARGEQVEATIRDLQRTEPPCEHHTAAGQTLHPTTGLMLCPLCREGVPARAEERGHTHPAIVAALDAYRGNATGPLNALTLMRITQEATALHNRQIPDEILTQLAAKAAQTNTGLLAAATAQ